MYKAYKFNFKPNKDQAEFLQKHLGACRFIYNRALSRKINFYQKENKQISCFDLIRELTPLKKTQEFQWLNEIYNSSLKTSILNLDVGFAKFFKENKGFPKFKCKNSPKQSYQYPRGVKICEGGILKLPKLKKTFKLNGFRSFEGKIKTTTISYESDGKYYASILVDNGIELPKKIQINKESSIAIDVGVIFLEC